MNGYASYSRDVRYTNATNYNYRWLSMKQAYRKKSQNIKTMFNSVSIIQMMNGTACSVFEVVSRHFHIGGTVPVSVTRVSVKR